MSAMATLMPGKLNGVVNAIPSKSELHRMLIAASLAGKETCIDGICGCISEDIAATVRTLCALGAQIECNSSIVVRLANMGHGDAVLDCGESGSTLRFLIPLAAALAKGKSCFTFTGAGRLPGRPVGELLGTLRLHGACIEGDALPFRVSGSLKGGRFVLPGNVTSQYVSGLMFALPLLPEDSVILLTTPLESAAYVHMTVAILRRFGIAIEDTGNGWRIPGAQAYTSPGRMEPGGDWSSAVLWLAANALGSNVRVIGLEMDTTQGDKAAPALLEAFGARDAFGKDWFPVAPVPLHGAVIDARETPDLLPVLAIVAAAAAGETRFVNAGRLRLKESDRLAATAGLLNALGGEAYAEGDTLRIVGHGGLEGGECDIAGDHRLVMAAALASTCARKPVSFYNPGAVAKSYPGFWKDFIHLGGFVNGI